MNDFERYLVKEKFYLNFKKYILNDKVGNSKEMLDQCDNILSCIKDIISSIKKVHDRIQVEENIKNFFTKITTLIDLSMMIYSMSYSVNIKSDKYNKFINQFLDKEVEENEIIKLEWLKIIKKVRGAIEHEYKSIELIEKEGRILFQLFDNKKYPIVLDFLDNNQYVDFLIFSTYKFNYVLRFLKVLFDLIVRDNSQYSVNVLLEMEIDDDFIVPYDMILILESNYKRAQKKNNIITEKQTQEIEFYSQMEYYEDTDNNDKVKSKLARLNKLIEGIECNKLSKLDTFYKSEIYFHAGNCYYSQREYEKSVASYERCLEYNASVVPCTNILNIFIHYEKWEDKIKERENIINKGIEIISNIELVDEDDDSFTLSNEISQFLVNVGVCYEKDGKIEEAIQIYEFALNYNDKDTNILFNIGRMCRELAKKEPELKVIYYYKSIEFCKKIIDINANDIQAISKLLNSALEINNFKIYKTYLLIGLKENPLSTELHEYCEMIIKNYSNIKELIGDSFIKNIVDILIKINPTKMQSNYKLQEIIKSLNDLNSK